MSRKKILSNTRVDREFASVVVSNQLNFNNEGYELQYFSLPEPQDYPEKYSLTEDVHQYINYLAEKRIQVYKRAMRGIAVDASEDIVDAKYTSFMQSAYQDLCRKGYSHKDFMEYCADVCTYSRCIYLKGLTTPSSCPKLYIERALSLLRRKDSFEDDTYSQLDIWLFSQVAVIKKKSGPINMNPIELSLDWINPPAKTTGNISSNSDSSLYAASSSSAGNISLHSDSSPRGASCSYRSREGNVDEDDTEDSPRKRKRLRL